MGENYSKLKKKVHGAVEIALTVDPENIKW